MSRADSPLRDRMLFLVGAQRSGTQWLQRILATHPEVVSLRSETQLFTHAISRLAEVVHHGVLSSPTTAGVYMDPDAFRDATRDLCDAVFLGVTDATKPGRTVVLERSPNHVYHLDLISAVYPDAAVVHIIRDGRDVVRSQLAQAFGPESVAEAARGWRRAIESARAHGPSFRRYVEVRYEALLDDPGTVVRGVFADLGLPSGEGLIDAAIREAKVTSSVDPTDRRVGADKWRATWTQRDLDTFLAEVGPLAGDFDLAAGAPLRRRRPRLSRLHRRSAPKAPLTNRERLRDATRTVDRFLTALATGDASALAERSSASIEVRVVDSNRDDRAAGAAGMALLVEAVRSDGGGWSEQVRGDMHTGSPTVTVVLTHRGDDGRLADRVLVIRPRGEEVDKVTYYRFPLVGPAGASDE
jgi:hypothetical protein